MPSGMARSRGIRLGLATLACAVLAAAAAVPAPAAVCAGAYTVPSSAGVPAARGAVLCLVNRQRAAHGLRPLRTDGRLERAAARHSDDMVARRYFDHTSPAGSTLRSRVVASGYLAHARAWMAGENIAWGDGSLGTPSAIVAACMDSPGHRANILRPQFHEVGTGIAPGVPATGRRLHGATYTQDFGGRG
jgi:uncharacterized protein YkwD